RTINAWVEKQTHRRIQELFAPGALDIKTRLVLASAIYFKADWVHAFSKNQTRNEVFWLDAERKTQVPLMTQTATLGYFENEQLQGLRLPYDGKNLALLVLLPRKVQGLTDLEKTLSAEGLANCLRRTQGERKVEVYLPKFKLTSEFELKEP